MEKKEFQNIAKEKFKSLGFRARGNHYYKMIDEDYCMCISLIHQNHGKGYFIDFGVVYAPFGNQIPFKGDFDSWQMFLFSANDNINLTKEILYEPKKYKDKLVRSFLYEDRSEESLLELLDLNLEKMIHLFSDKEFGLNYWKENIGFLCSQDREKIVKIIKLAEIPKNDIMQWRMHYGYKDNSYILELYQSEDGSLIDNQKE